MAENQTQEAQVPAEPADIASEITAIVDGLQGYQSGLNRIGDYLARVDKYVASLDSNLRNSGLLRALANFDQAKETAELEQRVLDQLATIQRWQQQAKAADDKALRELGAQKKLDEIRNLLAHEKTDLADAAERAQEMDALLSHIARLVDGRRGHQPEAGPGKQPDEAQETEGD